MAANEAKPIIARWAWPITQSVKWTKRLTGISACNEPCRLTTRYATMLTQTKRSGTSRATTPADP